jgi:hypothetical protein
MRSRLLAAGMLFSVYVGAPMLAPERHTALAAGWCTCDHVAQVFTRFGEYIEERTSDASLGFRDNASACQAACYSHAQYNWGPDLCLETGTETKISYSGVAHYNVINTQHVPYGPSNPWGCWDPDGE